MFLERVFGLFWVISMELIVLIEINQLRHINRQLIPYCALPVYCDMMASQIGFNIEVYDAPVLQKCMQSHYAAYIPS